MPLFYRKRLSELKIVSIILGVVFANFIGTFIFQLCYYGTSKNPDFDDPEPTITYFDFKRTWKIISIFSVVINSLCFHNNLFPLY